MIDRAVALTASYLNSVDTNAREALPCVAFSVATAGGAEENRQDLSEFRQGWSRLVKDVQGIWFTFLNVAMAHNVFANGMRWRELSPRYANFRYQPPVFFLCVARYGN